MKVTKQIYKEKANAKAARHINGYDELGNRQLWSRLRVSLRSNDRPNGQSERGSEREIARPKLQLRVHDPFDCLSLRACVFNFHLWKGGETNEAAFVLNEMVTLTASDRCFACVCVCVKLCVCVGVCVCACCQPCVFLLRFCPCNVHLILFMLTIAETNTHDNARRWRERWIEKWSERKREGNADNITNSFPQVLSP